MRRVTNFIWSKILLPKIGFTQTTNHKLVEYLPKQKQKELIETPKANNYDFSVEKLDARKLIKI